VKVVGSGILDSCLRYRSKIELLSLIQSSRARRLAFVERRFIGELLREPDSATVMSSMILVAHEAILGNGCR